MRSPALTPKDEKPRPETVKDKDPDVTPLLGPAELTLGAL
jgi:hypothetical protein